MYMAVAGSLYVRGCIDACICLSLPASLSFLASLSRFLSDTRLYVYIHTCYVLIKPPIPYLTSSRCKRLRILRPLKFLHTCMSVHVCTVVWRRAHVCLYLPHGAFVCVYLPHCQTPSLTSACQTACFTSVSLSVEHSQRIYTYTHTHTHTHTHITHRV